MNPLENTNNRDPILRLYEALDLRDQEARKALIVGIVGEMSAQEATQFVEVGLLNAVSGLPARITMGKYVEEARKQDKPCSLLFVDLTNFKAINDHAGYTEGDYALAHAGQTLSETVIAESIRESIRTDIPTNADNEHRDNDIKDTDKVFHFGGDEFGILAYGDMPEQQAIKLGERIALATISSEAFLTYNAAITGPGRKVLSTGVRIGATKVSLEADGDINAIIQRADPKNGNKSAELFCKFIGDGKWQYVNADTKVIYELDRNGKEGQHVTGDDWKPTNLKYKEKDWINPRKKSGESSLMRRTVSKMFNRSGVSVEKVT